MKRRDRANAGDDTLVVATKLHIPAPRRGRAPRRELIAFAREAREAKLLLVAAPAGSGKTTLLASWCAFPAEKRPFAWVSLDEEDNDPVRFWSYILAALRTVEPGFGADVVAALRAPGADVTELAVPLVVNELASLSPRVVLVLDDYHMIENPDIHRSVEFFLDHLPPTIQLGLSARSDPPLPLARLRASGDLVEVRAVDLRLTGEQAAALLNDSLGLDLDGGEIAQLLARTEGWAAGLQLVGLSLLGRGDRGAYIASFAGDDRHIVDYLALEVLGQQKAETREFLLQTSILDRLCGSLCDDVTGGEGSAVTLERLERANLFVVPLDDRREWYRYHHLFRDLLRHELRSSEPDLIDTLHRRAYVWHREHGHIPEAIRHATAVGDADSAAELIAANWLTYVNRGELETVEAWTRALPPGAAEADPRLCLARAWMLLVLGRLEEVEPSVRLAERGTLPGPMQDGSRSVEASAAMVRTSVRLMLGDVAGAAETAALAAELEPDPNAPWRPIVTNALGMTAYWSGRTSEAVAAFRETDESAQAVGNHSARIYALGYLAKIKAEEGDDEGADRVAKTALALARRRHLAEHWVTIMAHYALAETARRRREIVAAEAAFERGLALAARAGLRLDMASGLLALAQLRREQGQADDGKELLRRAREQVAGCADPGALARLVARDVRKGIGYDAGAPGGRDLSERELAVLRLLPTRLSQREIGAELYVSLNTVKSHSKSLFRKLNASSRGEAVARARELGLL